MSSPVSKHKIVFLGDIFVGKTSILRQFMSESFDFTYNPTIGIDYLSKKIHMGDRTVHLQLWDTAGSERFRTILPGYIRESAVAVIVFDVTVSKTFDSILQWIQDVKNERGDEAQIIIVGNKIDKEDERVVENSDAADQARNLGYAYIETSAKSGDNIPELFKLVASLLPRDQFAVSPNNIQLSNQPQDRHNKCKC